MQLIETISTEEFVVVNRGIILQTIYQYASTCGIWLETKDVEDLFQDVSTSLVKYNTLERYNPRYAFSTYINTVLNNAVIVAAHQRASDDIKYKTLREPYIEESHVVEPEDLDAQIDFQTMLDKMRADPTIRYDIIERLLQGYSINEIAQQECTTRYYIKLGLETIKNSL